jgi:predicted DNA-binding protein (UPF0278 family)
VRPRYPAGHGIAAQVCSKATLDTLTKTSASLVEQQVNERVAALREKHAEAVEAGDADQR